jgi:hypothetical protein
MNPGQREHDTANESGTILSHVTLPHFSQNFANQETISRQYNQNPTGEKAKSLNAFRPVSFGLFSLEDLRRIR